MIDTSRNRLAQRLAVAIPVLLLGGAYISELVFGLFPCEMCWWQRYAHFAALGLALMSIILAPKRLWVAGAGLAIITAGVIGGFHAGVEYGWWEGATACASNVALGTGSALDRIMNAPLIRCDVSPWDLWGISLAGWNFIISTSTGIAIVWLALRRGAA